MKLVVLFLMLSLVIVTANPAEAAMAYWTKRQAEQRVVNLIPKKLNPFPSTARRQCAGFRPSNASHRYFRGFTCIIQRKDGSFFNLTLRVLTATRGVVSTVSCIHYAINTTGPRAC